MLLEVPDKHGNYNQLAVRVVDNDYTRSLAPAAT